MGKRKIDMLKIENKNSRSVTFSKRRTGLFHKAADICLLCDAQVAVIVFSGSGKPYSFGHSSVESVLDHYRSGTTPLFIDSSLSVHMKHSMESMAQTKRVLKDQGFWWEHVQIDEINSLGELTTLITGIEQVKDNTFNKLVQMENSRVSSSVATTDQGSSNKPVEMDNSRVPLLLTAGEGEREGQGSSSSNLPLPRSCSTDYDTLSDCQDICALPPVHDEELKIWGSSVTNSDDEMMNQEVPLLFTTGEGEGQCSSTTVDTCDNHRPSPSESTDCDTCALPPVDDELEVWDFPLDDHTFALPPVDDEIRIWDFPLDDEDIFALPPLDYELKILDYPLDHEEELKIWDYPLKLWNF